MEADTQKVKEEVQKVEQKLLKQQKKIKELAPTVQGLERLAAEYSSRSEEWSAGDRNFGICKVLPG